MKYDGKLDIAVGVSARSRKWKNEKWKWSTLVQKLLTEHKTYETLAQYKGASKDERSKIKDVGGYVGGYLRGGRRKSENVLHRQLLTLDIDDAHADFWDDFCLQFDAAAVLHATHSHTPEAPKFRLVMPVNREVSADEYVAISRQVAGVLGIDLFDNTTFETARLMFWPSNPKDTDYYAQFQDGPWYDADAALDSYVDWTDSSQWPTAQPHLEAVRGGVQKQADPETKRGIVGAFCRAHAIEDVIETFLDDVYEPAQDGRYTYVNGTTSAGLAVYEGKFAYSHHGTDPSGGRLCNAFDLVRVHKFGHLDSSATSLDTRSKSYKAMEEFARKDQATLEVIADETLTSSKYDFSQEPVEKETEKDTKWAANLEVDSRGQYRSTATNLNLIFANDPRLAGLFKENEFDGKRYIFGDLPWRKIKGEYDVVRNVDYSGVRNYIETVYGISGNTKIDDALALEFEKYSFHPVRDYLKGLKWDGEPRIDTLLIDFFGAEDTIYTREALRKSLVGAVARIFRPGTKFDLVLTIVGKQGTGKSTFINKLGGAWFSDTFLTVQGKEALEQIQGAWLIEIAELAGLRKAEVEAIKHFISKQEDMFRPAYARTSETYKRQCVFFGTTNNKDFLRDPSGNRRFLPIDTNLDRVTKDIFTDLDPMRDQIWAEAVQLYRDGEPLYLSEAVEVEAHKEQVRHSETDERMGLVEDFLERGLPKNWDEMDVWERRDYLSDPLSANGQVQRTEVCAAEIWCECLGKEKEDMSRYNTRDINDILRRLEDWDAAHSTRNFPIYGKQKYYVRRNRKNS